MINNPDELVLALVSMHKIKSLATPTLLFCIFNTTKRGNVMKISKKLIIAAALLAQSSLSWGGVDVCPGNSYGTGYIVSIETNSNLEDFIALVFTDDIYGKVNRRNITFQNNIE